MRMRKVNAAIVGPGNIGIDLMMKIIKKSKYLDLVYMAGIVEDSAGLRMASEYGIRTSHTGISDILDDEEIKIVFEATSAKAHLMNAPLYRRARKKVVDLTPAAVGKYVIPTVNLWECRSSDNVNMVTCGGQATVPVVHAISMIQPVKYAEIISTIASKSAGAGTRENIDEFTETTANALVRIGGAQKGKAIMILNPATPPIMMRNTIYAEVPDPDMELITASVERRAEEIREYVPGYKMTMPPVFDGEKISVMVEVQGAGDYLPVYAGNLDIMTSAAVRAGEEFAKEMLV